MEHLLAEALRELERVQETGTEGASMMINDGGPAFPESGLRRNDGVASHDGGCLYRLKSDYSLEYWRGALEGAFKECEQIERALGLPPEVHTIIYTRLKQWESLLNWLEEVREDALLRQVL
jgi:hypothetical protein